MAGPGFTTVTATIADISGTPYANGTWSANFVNPGTPGVTPLINNSPITTVYAGTMNNAGFFTVDLPDNVVIGTQSGALGTQWRFAFDSKATLTSPSISTSAVTLTITGATQNISAAVQPAVPRLVSIGTLLRRVASVAAINNPVINTPLGPAPAWVTLTAYQVGQVVSIAGYQYICVIAGTSGASGPSGQGMAPIVDATVTWSYYGISVPAAAQSIQPAITNSASVPGGLTNVYAYNATPAPFYFTQGQLHISGIPMYNNVALSFNAVPGPNASTGFAVTFVTDSTKLAIKTSSGQNSIRLIVDGQYVTISGYVNGTGSNPSYVVMDFTNAGALKNRTITVAYHNNDQFGGVLVAPTESVWQPPTQDRVRVVWVGDSVDSGVSLIDATIPHQIGYLLGWSDVWNDSTGGTGFVSTASGAQYSYPKRIVYDVIPANPDLVVVSASINDVNAPGIQAAVLSTLQQIRAGLPSVPIIVSGILPDAPNNGGSANITRDENSVKAGVAQFNDPNTYFIPVNGDPVAPWITGTGTVTSPSGTGNADAYISGDTVHPTDLGTAYVTRRLALAIRNIIQQIP